MLRRERTRWVRNGERRPQQVGDSLQPWHIGTSLTPAPLSSQSQNPRGRSAGSSGAHNTRARMRTGAETPEFRTDLTFTPSAIVPESCFANGSRMHCETPCGIRALSSVPACSCGTRRPRRRLRHPGCRGHGHLHPPHSGKQDPATRPCRLTGSGIRQRAAHWE